MMRHQDLAGQVFNRLTAVSRVENTNEGRARWRCVCACGGEKLVAAAELKKGRTQSCGCLAREQRQHNARAQSHDKSKRNHPRAKRAWENMLSRCYKPADRMYKSYGGRGIGVCQSWRDNFSVFLTDMGDPPAGMTLDRVDNSLGYSPYNCRWASYVDQANNRRTNRIITIGDTSQTVAQWARQLGISCHVIHTRLYKGMSEHDAVMRPLRGH